MTRSQDAAIIVISHESLIRPKRGKGDSHSVSVRSSRPGSFSVAFSVLLCLSRHLRGIIRLSTGDKSQQTRSRTANDSAQQNKIRRMCSGKLIAFGKSNETSAIAVISPKIMMQATTARKPRNTVDRTILTHSMRASTNLESFTGCAFARGATAPRLWFINSGLLNRFYLELSTPVPSNIGERLRKMPMERQKCY